LRAIIGVILLVWSAQYGFAYTLALGEGSSRDWKSAGKESRFLGVHRDSIWMWHVEPNTNLATGMVERGGKVWYAGQLSPDEAGVLIPLRGGEVLFDGDGNTAFDPDSTNRASRSSAIFIDLGGTFRIDRLRFYPRLDRTNKRRFLQEFQVLTNEGGGSALSLSSPFASLFSYYAANANAVPVVDRRFDSRSVRYIQVLPFTGREWEIAELEVYGDGTLPVGEYLSSPLRAQRSNIIWGKVLYEGGSIEKAPVVVRTRTGPDREPEHFFRKLPEADEEFERVSEEDYKLLEEEERGPIKPNPEWSGWETVTDGMMRSPGLQRYLQFQIKMTTPGAVLKQLIFEYVEPPLARELIGEISPAVVEPGVETEFVLSMFAYLKTGGSKPDTGFRQLQVQTPAEIVEVERVLVDDKEVFASHSLQPGEGFTVNLWRRVEQDGTFVQIFFKGVVLRDRTRFELRALDRRVTDDGLEEAYQLFGEGEVDPSLPGRGLVVQLNAEDEKLPLIANVQSTPIFTPNGDGVNDHFELDYALLKLMEPGVVTLDIFDLSGRRVRRAYSGQDLNGRYELTWDGRDENGALVPVGLYLYRLQVEAGLGDEEKQGSVGVAY
jgi:hypothetical protein